MNLRYYRNQSTPIATLADQAHEEMVMRYAERMKTEYPGDVIFYDMFNQKFAELIIQECAKLVKDKALSIAERAELYADDTEELDTAKATAWQFSVLEQEIKKHFGVE